ncbi:Part of the ABC transporter FtsEX involved in cellular division [Vibrio sp. B1FLJ16]|uniref:permease-like cell division protein FtsX n=1 Tax=Vibrio sp. B1FLJ16 TaxID=2751178 RepID=UPI0015F3E722|nr:permease-like cell division protein FtsX [Vibrio sp. B1FLJ16]CAD7813610.1 Part of the ABC transporter FtsEX involved in cellular division [Vibrio sp. B1FLJ16]CAE6920564.1 Part of the ABC transporter FtsEX involved in cellular division [Vibrio sp. B1FLJ16]
MAGKKQSQKKGNNPKRSNSDGFFSVHIKEAKASFSALWQRPLGNILTLAVVSIALAMPACLYLLGKNVAGAAEGVASPSQVSAYLVEGMPDARVMVLKDEIETWPLVKGVEYISPQQGLDDLSQYAGFDQALSLLSGYALPGVLVITPESDVKSDIQSIAGQVREQQDVTDVRLDEDWLARLDAIKTLAGIVVITLSVLMLGAVFLIVGNTLRFNVLANKEEIQTMKLIGATDSFILRPYLYTGMWFGILGATIAWLVTTAVTLVMNSAVEDLAALYDSQFRLDGLNWDESLLLIITGSLIGCIAARISAQRHLKEIEPV